MKNFTPTDYRLVNVADGRSFEDKGWTLADPLGSSPSLVRAVYSEKQLRPNGRLKGIYRYACWLPVNHTLRKSRGPVTWKSEGLARELGESVS